MTREEFNSTFSFFQLSSLIQQATSNHKLRGFLHTFTCSINVDLQNFLHNKAITFEKHLRARTYIYVDNHSREIAAYFTIAISTLHTEGISSDVIKMLDGYQDNTKSIPCFLIGQLGKSDHYKDKKIGLHILNQALEIIDRLHEAVGGRFILLDAINDKNIIDFYAKSLFFPIEVSTDAESIKMIRPYFDE